jgi:hypothetical protein
VTLEEALEGARRTDRTVRVAEWRDRIAAYGPPAIDAMFEWAGDPELGAFAVTVIEAAGRSGHAAAALDALSAFSSIGASADVRRYSAAAIERLRPASSGHVAFRRQTRVHADAGLDWPGFQASDFGDVTGTTWRRRDDSRALVPLLLRPLLRIDSDLATYPIYALPEVHFAARDRYEQGSERWQGWRASKLVVYAHGPRDGHAAHVAVGYYVEKGTGADKFGPIDRALWDWPRFVEVLGDATRRAPLDRAFERHPLAIGDYVGGRFGRGGAQVGFVGRVEGGELVLRDSAGVSRGMGWESLASIVATLPEGKWHDLHVWREWPAEEAVAAGQPFALHAMVPVLRDLAATYEEVIGGGIFGHR